MIGSLNGTVSSFNNKYILLEVGGVGYKVTIAKDVLSKIKNNGQRLKLFTFTHVREDLLELYGFLEAEDLDLFEKLINVSGIGPKTAMGIFSIGTRNHITEAVLNADVDFFEKVPRLGHKNAQKIIIELKTKLGGGKEIDLTDAQREENKQLLTALKNFGFNKSESLEAIKEIGGSGANIEEKIKLALKYLGQ